MSLTFLHPIVARDILHPDLLRKMVKTCNKMKVRDYDRFENEDRLLLVHKKEVVADADNFEDITLLMKSHYDYDNCYVVVPPLFRRKSKRFNMELRPNPKKRVRYDE